MATEDHCAHCFDALVCHFQRTGVRKPRYENGKYPLFVSWHKVSSRDEEHSLRGCRGTFTSQDLHKSLPEFSLISALKDTRFDPISADEIPRLHCGVSLLTNFEDGKDAWDWEIGKHGIIIDFTDPRGDSRSGTYLPEVMPEQGWTKREAVDSLIKKAGWKGQVSDALYQSIKLTRYQSSKSAMHYHEYAEKYGLPK